MSNKPNEQSTEPEMLDEELQPDPSHQPAAKDMEETVDLEDLFRKSRAASTPAPPPSDNERVQEAERQVLLVRAEMENFRKRMQRDSEQQLKYANLPLLRDLLDVVDNLNRAKDAAKSDSTNNQALLSGVEMVSKLIESVIAKYGCRPIEAVGAEFDPNVHEAIAQVPSQEHAAGKVAQEVAVGYLLHDRVIRPSSVMVSTGPAN